LRIKKVTHSRDEDSVVEPAVRSRRGGDDDHLIDYAEDRLHYSEKKPGHENQPGRYEPHSIILT
jgi:hypothetical protein